MILNKDTYYYVYFIILFNFDSKNSNKKEEKQVLF